MLLFCVAKRMRGWTWFPVEEFGESLETWLVGWFVFCLFACLLVFSLRDKKPFQLTVFFSDTSGSIWGGLLNIPRKP